MYERCLRFWPPGAATLRRRSGGRRMRGIGRGGHDRHRLGQARGPAGARDGSTGRARDPQRAVGEPVARSGEHLEGGRESTNPVHSRLHPDLVEALAELGEHEAALRGHYAAGGTLADEQAASVVPRDRQGGAPRSWRSRRVENTRMATAALELSADDYEASRAAVWMAGRALLSLGRAQRRLRKWGGVARRAGTRGGGRSSSLAPRDGPTPRGTDLSRVAARRPSPSWRAHPNRAADCRTGGERGALTRRSRTSCSTSPSTPSRRT